MATDVDTLLHDVLVFMQQLLQQQALPAECQDGLRALVARLRQADGAYRPSYLDMNGTLRRLHPAAHLAEDTKDTNHPWLAAAPSAWPPCPPMEPARSDAAAQDDTDSGTRMRTMSADSGDLDTSADCSECLDDSNDDWPPRGAPTCLRPDLSPDWAVSAAAARDLALHSGAVYRAAPGRWFRRRGWAALLPSPARLLVFSGARSSRPRLVLLLAQLAPVAASGTLAAPLTPCCDPCCAVYSARPRQQGPAFELCCPGRKTHQLWVSDEKEAQAWVEALRRAPQPPSHTSSPSPPLSSDGRSAAGAGASDRTPDNADPSIRPGSRSRSESRSVSMVGDSHRISTAEVQDSMDGDQTPPLPPPPLTPPPVLEDLQQEYESMMAGSEEIYHDIAAPEPAAPGAPGPSMLQCTGPRGCPSYVNVHLHLNAASLAPGESTDVPEVEDVDGQTRPLYDDVAARPLAPEYCNLGRDEEEHAMGEHLYDDIGPTETRASVYELIQDPNQVIGQGIRCS